LANFHFVGPIRNLARTPMGNVDLEEGSQLGEYMVISNETSKRQRFCRRSPTSNSPACSTLCPGKVSDFVDENGHLTVAKTGIRSNNGSHLVRFSSVLVLSGKLSNFSSPCLSNVAEFSCEASKTGERTIQQITIFRLLVWFFTPALL